MEQKLRMEEGEGERSDGVGKPSSCRVLSHQSVARVYGTKGDQESPAENIALDPCLTDRLALQHCRDLLLGLATRLLPPSLLLLLFLIWVGRVKVTPDPSPLIRPNTTMRPCAGFYYIIILG